MARIELSGVSCAKMIRQCVAIADHSFSTHGYLDWAARNSVSFERGQLDPAYRVSHRSSRYSDNGAGHQSGCRGCSLQARLVGQASL